MRMLIVLVLAALSCACRQDGQAQSGAKVVALSADCAALEARAQKYFFLPRSYSPDQRLSVALDAANCGSTRSMKTAGILLYGKGGPLNCDDALKWFNKVLTVENRNADVEGAVNSKYWIMQIRDDHAQCKWKIVPGREE